MFPDLELAVFKCAIMMLQAVSCRPPADHAELFWT